MLEEEQVEIQGLDRWRSESLRLIVGCVSYFMSRKRLLKDCKISIFTNLVEVE